MRKFYFLPAAILLIFFFSGIAAGTTITSQVGVVAPDGTTDPTILANTLSSGPGSYSSLQWTHTYSLDGIILSAILEIDLIDAENSDPNRGLYLYAGTDVSGEFIGQAVGINQDGVGWLDLNLPNASINNVFAIPSNLYGDLTDGSFSVFGSAQNIGSWGSNRALLTIETAPVPEPNTMLLLGFGLIGLAGTRRKFKK